MVSHYSPKFGDHKHCACGDIILVVQEYDSTGFQIDPSMLFTSKAHDTWYYQPQFWSHSSWVMNYETLAKKLLPDHYWETNKKERKKQNYKKDCGKASYIARKHNTERSVLIWNNFSLECFNDPFTIPSDF